MMLAISVQCMSPAFTKMTLWAARGTQNYHVAKQKGTVNKLEKTKLTLQTKLRNP